MEVRYYVVITICVSIVLMIWTVLVVVMMVVMFGGMVGDGGELSNVVHSVGCFVSYTTVYSYIYSFWRLRVQTT